MQKKNVEHNLTLKKFLLRKIYQPFTFLKNIIGTSRYENAKGSTGTAVDAGNFRGPRSVAADKILKMCIFVQDGEVNIYIYIFSIISELIIRNPAFLLVEKLGL